eukprot:CAMPEP_0118948950 /NCGR_PEP_ID=MMETSP1169-20130426/48737_1 /TAXON_ID=36882 /ORGANISM="Pyramimonas obovata, Strain CCMP722" /LENGTH=233 /DNA_ID=CAMNT_0006895479 /DNA_START=855 /DNA_END=1553 /DNA_ORIENTATION=-
MHLPNRNGADPNNEWAASLNWTKFDEREAQQKEMYQQGDLISYLAKEEAQVGPELVPPPWGSLSMLSKEEVSALRVPLPPELQPRSNKAPTTPKYTEDVLAGLPKPQLHTDPRYGNIWIRPEGGWAREAMDSQRPLNQFSQRRDSDMERPSTIGGSEMSLEVQGNDEPIHSFPQTKAPRTRTAYPFLSRAVNAAHSDHAALFQRQLMRDLQRREDTAGRLRATARRYLPSAEA